MQNAEPQKPRYGSEDDLKKAIAELRATLGNDTVRTDSEDRVKHNHGVWSEPLNVLGGATSAAVVYPTSTTDVSIIARVCHQYHIPMVPYAGGSSTAGSFAPLPNGLSIDFANMNRIVVLHEDDKNVVVQPAVGWVQLNEELKSKGLFLPVDPGMPARIGGMVGTNCSGTNAFRYGTMRQWVMNLTVVMANGTIVKTKGGRPPKTSAGYDLTSLFVGSEGTLGMVTEICLKLAVLPKTVRVGVVTVSDLDVGVAATMRVIKEGVVLEAIELLDDRCVSILNQGIDPPDQPWQEINTILFKFGGIAVQVTHNIEHTRSILSASGVESFKIVESEEEALKLWETRKMVALQIQRILAREKLMMKVSDVAVPLSNFAALVNATKMDLEASRLPHFPGIIGHIGDGNFHVGYLYDKEDPEQVATVQRTYDRMVQRAVEMEGTCTGEHGVGILSKEYLVKELGMPAVNLMASLKSAWDEHWLLNPGKIFDFPA